MREKNIKINYFEYASLSELPDEERKLLEEAMKATLTSYAPYSGFNVGAAVLLSDGTMVIGSNQENIAYPSGLCAERTALFAAHANYPDKWVKAIAVASRKDGILSDLPVSPCGACRQVLAESQLRSGNPVKIILGGMSKVLVFSSVDMILPFIFNGEGVNRAGV